MTLYITFYSTAALPPEPVNPCIPSPCGPYAHCQVRGSTPSCSCLPSYIGIPPNCRPECITNSECPSNRACVNQKCKDPCPGACAVNAECTVISHTPTCNCPSGYTGNPFAFCSIIGIALLFYHYFFLQFTWVNEQIIICYRIASTRTY